MSPVKLSFLIPIFNFDVTELVSELHKQSVAAGIEFEILCYDDASEEKFKIKNKSVSSLINVQFSELKKNLGRSKIRNFLANEAKYENLVFLDCDSKITSGDFVKNYVTNISSGTVVFGGRGYDQNFPLDKRKFLRWIYGMKREFIPVEIRVKNPYRYFMTNNFLIPRDIFLTIQMNENLLGYGHEDTQFAQDLKKKKIVVRHIENYLFHIGLESADEFLFKTKQGIANLAFLIKNNMVDEEVKIFRYYNFVKKKYLKIFVKLIFIFFQKQMILNLKSGSPKLAYFDFLKLNWLIIEMDRRENTQ